MVFHDFSWFSSYFGSARPLKIHEKSWKSSKKWLGSENFYFSCTLHHTEKRFARSRRPQRAFEPGGASWQEFFDFLGFSWIFKLWGASRSSKNDSGVETIIFPALYTILRNVSRGRGAPSARLNRGAPRDKDASFCLKKSKHFWWFSLKNWQCTCSEFRRYLIFWKLITFLDFCFLQNVRTYFPRKYVHF